MNFHTDIHGPQMMNPNDFSSSTTTRSTFVALSEMSQQILDELQ